MLFTPLGAWVVNVLGEQVIKTQIATRTASRLYSFDVAALEEHVAKLSRLGKAMRGDTLDALECLDVSKLHRCQVGACGG